MRAIVVSIDRVNGTVTLKLTRSYNIQTYNVGEDIDLPLGAAMLDTFDFERVSNLKEEVRELQAQIEALQEGKERQRFNKALAEREELLRTQRGTK